VYGHYFKPILAFMARRVQDSDAAFDLTAETFGQAFASRHRFRGSTDEEAAAWIYRIASRQLARYRRRGTAQLQAIGRLQIELPALDAERRAAIEELADLDGVREALRAGLAQLSRAQREALGLRVLDDLPYLEVAERLKITEQAARARVSRGLKHLADVLDDDQTIKEMA